MSVVLSGCAVRAAIQQSKTRPKVVALNSRRYAGDDWNFEKLRRRADRAAGNRDVVLTDDTDPDGTESRRIEATLIAQGFATNSRLIRKAPARRIMVYSRGDQTVTVFRAGAVQ